MKDGSIAVVGGDDTNNSDASVTNGRKGVRIFKPCDRSENPNCTAGTWNNLTPLTTNRWYPTVLTLSNGDNMIIGGSVIALANYSLPAELNNPTYEYLPARSGGPQYLSLLAWAYPFNLYPQAFQLPSGRVFVMASNKSVTINTTDNTVSSLPDLPDLKHRPWIYVIIIHNLSHLLLLCLCYPSP